MSISRSAVKHCLLSLLTSILTAPAKHVRRYVLITSHNALSVQCGYWSCQCVCVRGCLCFQSPPCITDERLWTNWSPFIRSRGLGGSRKVSDLGPGNPGGQLPICQIPIDEIAICAWTWAAPMVISLQIALAANRHTANLGCGSLSVTPRDPSCMEQSAGLQVDFPWGKISPGLNLRPPKEKRSVSVCAIYASLVSHRQSLNQHLISPSCLSSQQGCRERGVMGISALACQRTLHACSVCAHNQCLDAYCSCTCTSSSHNANGCHPEVDCHSPATRDLGQLHIPQTSWACTPMLAKSAEICPCPDSLPQQQTHHRHRHSLSLATCNTTCLENKGESPFSCHHLSTGWDYISSLLPGKSFFRMTIMETECSLNPCTSQVLRAAEHWLLAQRLLQSSWLSDLIIIMVQHQPKMKCLPHWRTWLWVSQKWNLS